ncbi:MAG: DUF1761 domain-containing protein [Bacteroidetes bacterium]|nr:MAG: DUF1761 domain-containing protein [Bacteroidota bacterium]
MKDLNINHLAVWSCVILLHALGFLWYGPLFGDTWMNLVNLDQAAVEANPPGAAEWISNFIATVIPVYVLAWLFAKMGVKTALQGAAIGVLIAFSFVFLSRMTSNLFAQNPYGLTWINGGFDLVALGLSGLILGAWQKKGVKAAEQETVSA